MALQGAGALRAQINSVMPQVIASGLLVSLCTIQQPDGMFGATGGPSGNYVDVGGLVDIVCIDAPLSDSEVGASEDKQLAQIESKRPRHVALNACYMDTTYTLPNGETVEGIQPGWRAVINGIVWDICGAERDSQSTQTRLMVELVEI